MGPFSKQPLGKYVPAETNTCTTVEELCFQCGPRRRYILKTSWSVQNSVPGV
jgi:hypothetical protein